MPVETGGSRYLESDYIQKAKERGVEFEPRPVDRVVITGYAAETPLGNAEETWQKMLNGESGVGLLPRDRIGGLLKEQFLNGQRLLPTDERRGQSEFSKSAIYLGRQALKMAELLNTQGKLDTTIIPSYQAASWVGSGYAAADQMVEVHRRIQPGSRERVNPDLSLQIFPEEGNARVAEALGLQGSGGNTMEACATGASNPIEGYYRVKEGRAKIALVGGFETTFATHPDEMDAAFNALRAMATLRGLKEKQIEDPKAASRPFDRDRIGFVPSSGGAELVLEPLEQALERGATIYAEVLGVGKSMDAYKATDLNKQRVADTIAEALYDRKSKKLRIPDIILAHATSTGIGDLNEAEVFNLILGMKELQGIPVSAVKAFLGHMIGGAGSFNIVAGIQVLNEQKVPYILNLDNPDERVLEKGLYLLKDNIYVPPADKPIETVLANGFGFGGHNAVMLLGRYHPLHMAAA